MFTIPHKKINPKLVSVMMPFSKDYKEVYDTIKLSCEDAKMIANVQMIFGIIA